MSLILAERPIHPYNWRLLDRLLAQNAASGQEGATEPSDKPADTSSPETSETDRTWVDYITFT